MSYPSRVWNLIEEHRKHWHASRLTPQTHSPPTSGSRISITWLSGAFLTPTKGRSGWLGWKQESGAETETGKQSEPSRHTHTHTHTHTSPNITTWILTQTRGVRTGLFMTTRLFLLTVRLSESVGTWRFTTDGKRETFNSLVCCFMSLHCHFNIIIC